MENTTAVKDYGLSRARLFVIPVLSWFADIAGIFIRIQLAGVAPTPENLWTEPTEHRCCGCLWPLVNLVINGL